MPSKRKLLIFLVLLVTATIAIVLAYLQLNKKGTTNVNYRLYDTNNKLIEYDLKLNSTGKLQISGILKSKLIKSDDNGKYLEINLPESSFKKSETTIKAYFADEGVALLLLKGGKYETKQVWKAAKLDELSDYLFQDDQIILDAKINQEEYSDLIDRYYNSSTIDIFDITNIAVPSS